MLDQVTLYTVHGKTYEQQHGNPFDRGSADSWYSRARNPHKGGVGGGSGPRTEQLTTEEMEAYHAGYDYNEQQGGKKDYD
jgi:hypothetical protein